MQQESCWGFVSPRMCNDVNKLSGHSIIYLRYALAMIIDLMYCSSISSSYAYLFELHLADCAGQINGP